MPVKLSTEQQNVYRQIREFLTTPTPRRPFFTVSGLAGSGKSTLLAQLARDIPHAQVCAFTGKAASVLSRKIGVQAKTIHSTIYNFLGLNDDGDPIFRDKIETGEWAKRIVLLDEHSSVGTYLAADLLNTGARVVPFGDPGQLPPVKDNQFFAGPADATLYTIHRQALDSPIIRQAHNVRSGQPYQADGEAFQVVRHITQDQALSADIVLCWRNATRKLLNGYVRQYRGLDPAAPPQPGEPVMCLRNDHTQAILNGAIYTVIEYGRSKQLLLENERGQRISVKTAFEDIDPPPDPDDRKTVPFALAYAATVHKAQGSEWDRIILVDEYNTSRDRERWLYTGISRAAKSIIVQRCV
jgi:exodeoxyribonuclease-5